MIPINFLLLPILIALVILPRLSIDLYLPALPAIKSAMQASDTALQMTLTMFMLGYAFSMLIAGPLSDALGRKRVLILGLSLFLISTLLCAFANSISALIVARFFQALGGCCGTVIARVMVKDAYSREDQISILAQLSAAMAVCPLIIPIIGGTLQQFLGWRFDFYLLGIFAAILLLTTLLKLEETNNHRSALSVKELARHYYMLLRHREFIAHSLAIGCAWCNYFAFTLESPFLLQTVLGFNAIAFGAFMAIIVAGYVVGTRVTKRLANHLGWDRLIFIGSLLTLSGSILMIFLISMLTLSWQIIIFPMLPIMTGVGMIIPCSQGAVMQPFPTAAGATSGLFFCIQMLFGCACGFILQLFNPLSPLPMAIVIFISSFLLVISFYKLCWSTLNETLFFYEKQAS